MFFSNILGRIDYYDALVATAKLIGCIFLTILARFEHQELLVLGSKVKILALAMRPYLELSVTLVDMLDGDSDGSEGESSSGESKVAKKGPETRKKGPAPFKYHKGAWGNYIVRYAEKYNIPLPIETLEDERTSSEPSLPEAGTGPLGWSANLRKYKETHQIPTFGFTNRDPQMGVAIQWT